MQRDPYRDSLAGTLWMSCRFGLYFGLLTVLRLVFWDPLHAALWKLAAIFESCPGASRETRKSFQPTFARAFCKLTPFSAASHSPAIKDCRQMLPQRVRSATI